MMNEPPALGCSTSARASSASEFNLRSFSANLFELFEKALPPVLLSILYISLCIQRERKRERERERERGRTMELFERLFEKALPHVVLLWAGGYDQ